MRFAGISPEIGLAETQQTLVMNGLRNQVRLQTDGQLKTAKDVIIMAMLGADEFSFGTLPLIVLGCVMMRKCNTNTCPMGVATQNPELRKHFEGRAEYVVNFFTFLAEQVREYLSEIGVHSLKEIIGHTELIEVDTTNATDKQKTIDFARLLHKPETDKALYWDRGAFTKVSGVKDEEIIKAAQKAIDSQEEITLDYAIKNTDRAVGTMLSGAIAQKYGEEGLPDGTIKIKFKGSAGQSFGAFAVPLPFADWTCASKARPTTISERVSLVVASLFCLQPVAATSLRPRITLSQVTLDFTVLHRANSI